MVRLATPFAALLLLVALSAKPGGAQPTPSPSGASPAPAAWRHAEWPGVAPAWFSALPDGGDGVAVRGEAQASFVWRPSLGAPGCLSWRWRVDEGPPATDLTRRGGDDRALSVAVGFDGWPAGASAWQRARHGIAQARAGDSRLLPRSVLMYVWGGTGREPPLFISPYLGGFTAVRVLRPADAPRGRWFSERVDLAADWRAAFGDAVGGGAPPRVQEIALGTDVDDTASRVDAAVEAPVPGPCG